MTDQERLDYVSASKSDNPFLGDVCIPMAKIEAVLKLLNTEHLKEGEALELDGDVAVGIWWTLADAKNEIYYIVRHNEEQEYQEARVRREFDKALKVKVEAIRAGEVENGSKS